ncbi:MAG: hypothetical protein WCX71_00460 [Candidatus Buchananbacteria bacterium]
MAENILFFDLGISVVVFVVCVIAMSYLDRAYRGFLVLTAELFRWTWLIGLPVIAIVSTGLLVFYWYTSRVYLQSACLYTTIILIVGIGFPVWVVISVYEFHTHEAEIRAAEVVLSKFETTQASDKKVTDPS